MCKGNAMERSSKLYTNSFTSQTSDGFTFKQSSVPISNDIPASIIKQHSIPNDGPAHFRQLSVPTKSLTTTPRNLFLLRNKVNSEIMTPCFLHPPKSAANYATSRNLLLFFVQNDPAIMKPSLLLPRDFKRPAIIAYSLQLIVKFPSHLLFCVKDAPAIMMVTLTSFSLQLIVDTPSLLLLRDFERPAITAVTNGNFFFKFIVESNQREHNLLQNLTNAAISTVPSIFCFMSKSTQQSQRRPTHISCCFLFKTIQPIPSFI